MQRYISYLRNQAKSNIKRYIDERLPEGYEKCLVGLTAILREAWATSQQAYDKREKIQALSLAKECYSMKLDLLTNATVVDDAIRFVSTMSKENLKLANGNSNEDDKEESNEPDYDEDEELEEQEEETGQIRTNTVFQSLGTSQKSFYLVELVEEEEEQDESKTPGRCVNPEWAQPCIKI